MNRFRHVFTSASVACAALVAAHAMAKAPGNSAHVPPGPAPHGPVDPASARAEAAKERAKGAQGGQNEKAGKEKDSKEEDGKDGMKGANAGAGGAPGNSDHPGMGMGMGMGMGQHGAVRELIEQVRSGKITRDQFKQKLGEMMQDRAQRRTRHQTELRARWGQELNKGPVMAELRLHARREAFLSRMLVVAQTERSGKDQEKLVARIEAMGAREDARHDKKMAELKASGAAAAGGASAEPAAPAAPAASANGQGGAQ